MKTHPAEKAVQELFKDIPVRVLSPVRMDRANETIPVYQGNFFLVQDHSRWEIEGEITFVWFPDAGLKFNGTILHGKAFDFNSKDKIHLEAADTKRGTVQLTYFDYDRLVVEGVLELSVWGDASIGVTEVRFGVSNVREWLGGSERP